MYIILYIPLTTHAKTAQVLFCISIYSKNHIDHLCTQNYLIGNIINWC